MKLENISEKEKREILINSLDKNMFVEAGAGAGKTTLIVSRILRQLMNGIKPEEIVAITFTNAATRQLRGRILSEALEIAENGKGEYSQEERAALKEALPGLDRMQVSTIHSFCFRILSEKIFDARLSYGFGLMPEDELEELRQRYFNLWAEGLKREDWEKLLPAGEYRYRTVDRLKNLTRQLDGIPRDYSIEVAIPDLSEQEAQAKLQPIIDHISTEMVNLVNLAYGTRYSSPDMIEDSYLLKYGRIVRDTIGTIAIPEIFNVLLKLPNSESFILKAVTLKSLKERGIKNREVQEDFISAMKALDAKFRRYFESMADDVRRIRAGYMNTLFRPYLDYGKDALSYVRSKMGEGLISNDLLLEKTKDLVNTSEETRKFFGRKFKCIYVDEFQDTDHLQESFIWLLAAEPDHPEKLKDGALFVVGDPKQSIYRFRGAEPEVYFDAKKMMTKLDNAYVVELSDNHRSNDRIIDWVNRKFGTKDITPGQDYIPMNTVNPLPGSGLPDKLFAGVYRYASPEDALPEENIECDSRAVCELVLSLMDNGYQIAEKGKDGEVCYRRIKYSDFLILCMNTPGMDEYLRIFREYGIPVVIEGKTNVKEDLHIASFIRLYAFLASPMDRAARMGALEVLAESSAADGEKNEPLLDRAAEETADMSAYGCVMYLLKRPELYLKKDCNTEDYIILDMQKKIIQMTEKINAENYGNRGTLLAAMKKYSDGIVEHELLLKRDMDAVCFMNLHKAKGLEGNIVIWTNRIENRSFREGVFRSGKKFYPSIGDTMNNFNVTAWTAYGGETDLIDKAMREEQAESIRLEYVAATRAKQALVFMDRYNDKSGNMFSQGYDLMQLPSVEEIVSAYVPRTASVTFTEYKPKGRDAYDHESEIYAALKAPVFLSESPSDYEDNSAGLSESDPKNRQGTGKRPVGAVFGTVMHRTFELIVDRWNCDPKLLGISPDLLVPSCIRQAVNESFDDIPEGEASLYETFLQDAVMAFGTWFRNCDIKKLAEKIYTELPFSYMIPPEEIETEKSTPGKSPAVWMHGSADLVIRLNDGSYHIIDYKSDSDAVYPDEEAFEKRLRGKYSPQIEAYKAAVARVFNVTGPGRIKASLVSFSQKDVKKGEKLRVRITDI